jgi:hypothetical protein
MDRETELELQLKELGILEEVLKSIDDDLVKEIIDNLDIRKYNELLESYSDIERLCIKKRILSDLEDEMVKEFDIMSQTKYVNEDPKKELSKDECLNVITQWLEYWCNQKIIKIPNEILLMKKKISDHKIFLLMNQAAEWNLIDEIPESLMKRIRN